MIKRHEVRGLSTIVATLLVILLTMVSVGIIWVVIKNVIHQNSEQISLDKITLDLEIKNVAVNKDTPKNINVKVKRNAGDGDMYGIRLIFYVGGNSEVVEISNLSLKEFEERTINVSLVSIDNSSKIDKVSVAPLFKSSSGKELNGDIKDEYTIKKSSLTTSSTGCMTSSQCNDNIACTTDICSGGICSHTTITLCKDDDGCCPLSSAYGCDSTNDNNCAQCTTANQASACSDGNNCTEDICSGGACSHIPLEECCTSASECDDLNECTMNGCVDNACAYNPIILCNSNDGCCPPGCNSINDNNCATCTTANQASACSDGNNCTQDVCSGGLCMHSSIDNCCTSDTQCNDFDDCTTNTCSSNTCIYPPKANCCISNTQCNDNNACTNDACTGNACVFTPKTNCCTVNSQCNDNNACTTNTCSENLCSYLDITTCTPGDGCCPPGCNSVNDNNCLASCGNSLIDSGEQCDCGTNGCTILELASATCASRLGTGYTGTLGCTSSCQYNTTLCVPPCTTHSTNSCYNGDVYWYNSCGVREEVRYDCTSTQTCTSGACVNNCVAESNTAFCSRLGKNCGSVTALDNCGTSRTVTSCGSCTSPQTCGASNVCGCVAESNTAFCSRLNKNCGSVTANDNCLSSRTVNCGTCTSPQTCGASNVCSCVAESNTAFCSRLNKNCGSVTALDNCGTSRTVTSCGSCTSPQTCGASNVCGCVAESNTAFCSRLSKNCGSVTALDNCGTSRTVTSCGSCTSPQTCSASNVCGCVAESNTAFCTRLSKNCGSVTANDNCLSSRTVNCGSCTSPQTCNSNVCTSPSVQSSLIIVNHTTTTLSSIPTSCINKAKAELHIAYSHTSHGSQIYSGLQAVEAYNSLYAMDSNVISGQLHFEDYYGYGSDSGFATGGCYDLSNCDYVTNGLLTPTRDFLDGSRGQDINVIIWSWCAIGGHDIPKYLQHMQTIISEYENGKTAHTVPVKFVFMTGHVDATGVGGSSDYANVQIRNFVKDQSTGAFCKTHQCILYDFADIEEYDPDNNYFLNKYVTESLAYNSGHWGTEYFSRHPTGVNKDITNLMSSYGCAHSDSPYGANLNCALKGEAAWYMFARMVGWDGNPAHGC